MASEHAGIQPASSRRAAGDAWLARLVNNGAPGTWNLSVTINGQSPWAFDWYYDQNGNTQFDSEDAARQLPPAGGGSYRTGVLQTDEKKNLVAVALVPTTTNVGTYTLTVKATPQAPNATSPGATPPSQWEYTTPVQVKATGTSTFYRDLYLHNWDDVGNEATHDTETPSGDYNLMSSDAPGATELFNYDTNIDSEPGRTVAVGGSGVDEAAETKTLSWVYGVTQQSTISGTAYFDIDAVPDGEDPAFATGVVHVYLLVETAADVWKTAGTQTLSSSYWDPSFAKKPFAINVSGSYVVPANRRVKVIVQVDPGSTAGMRFAYDTNLYDGKLRLPYTSGSP